MRVDLLLVLAACTGGSEGERAPIEVACAPVETATTVDHLSVRGPVRPPPDRDAHVAAQVGGAVRAIHVREGDPVEVGAPLLDLDDRTLLDDVTAERAAVASAEARSGQVRAVAKRKAGLLGRGIVSRADAEAADADASQSDSDLAAARSALRAARSALERAHPTSPIAGRVLAIHARLGEVVDPAAPLVDIVDPGVLELVATVGVADLALLVPGQSAVLTVEGLPEVPASVSAVAPGVDGATGLGTVRIRLDAGGKLPVGAIATARVGVGEHVGRWVPATAIRSGAGGHEVVVCDGDVAHTVPVQATETSGERIEVVGELSASARVLVDAALPIDDGSPIEEAP